MKHTAPITTYFLTLSTLSLTLILNTGCNGSGNESTFGSIAIPSPAPALPGTSNGLLSDLDYFYVGVDTTEDAIAHVHSTAGFSSNCGVSKDSTTNEDITCIVEVPEADLYAKTLELKYNVPAGMCRYLVRQPYWFYNYEVGVGPKNINISIINSVDADGVITTTDYNCTIDGVPDAECDGWDPINGHTTVTEAVLKSREPSGVEFKCIYDNSASDGANCCFGSYRITSSIKTGIQDPVIDNISGEWGGDYSSCIGGPGKTDWSHYSKDGTPAWEVVFAKHGITEHQNVTAPIELKIGSNIHSANYYGGTIASPVVHDHDGFHSNRSSPVPFFVDPIDDRDGDIKDYYDNYTLLLPAQDSFEFQCLDEAFEIQHRIRVYVRDWDTYPDYLTYISSEGATVNPDRSTDDEPTPSYCEAIPYAGYSCNDFHDIDDYLKVRLNLANYDTTVGNIINRGTYFPSLGY